MSVSEVILLRNARGCSEDDVRRVVANCPKQRFTLTEDEGHGLLIRANQGHSIEVGQQHLQTIPLHTFWDAGHTRKSLTVPPFGFVIVLLPCTFAMELNTIYSSSKQ